MTTPNLNMPELTHGEYNGEVTHNHALQILDLFAQGTVINHAQADLPVGPAEGNAYIMSAAWDNGQADDIAHYYNGSWHFYTPSTTPNAQGWKMYSQVNQNTYYWTGTLWDVYVPVSLPDPAIGQGVLDPGGVSPPVQPVVSGVAEEIAAFNFVGPQLNLTTVLTVNSVGFTVTSGHEGVYEVNLNLSLQTTQNDKYKVELHADGAPTGIGFTLDVGNKDISLASGSVSVMTSDLAVGVVITAFITAEANNADLTYIAATINMKRLTS